MLFARKWRMWRQSQGWTACRLCASIDVSTGYWSRIESGKKLPPPDETIRRACEVMGSPERAGYWQTIARWDRVERTLVNPPSWVKRWLSASAEWDATGRTPTVEDVTRMMEG